MLEAIESSTMKRSSVSMLVLRRNIGEAIVLNQDIVIRVIAVQGDRVKLGIEAPLT
jgi:carbon storage regulator CsrA